jgi:hypothetical protein
MVESVWNHAEQHTEVEMNKIANSSKSPLRLERSDFTKSAHNCNRIVTGGV